MARTKPPTTIPAPDPNGNGTANGDGAVLDTLGYPLSEAKVDHEYIGGGPGYLLSPTAQILALSNDDAERAFGDRLYEVMRNDPVTGSCLDVLKLGVLSGNITIKPCVTLSPEDQQALDAHRRQGLAGLPENLDPAMVAEAELSAQVCDFCSWAMLQLKRPLKAWLFEMLDAWCFGAKLAEKVCTVEADPGPYKGFLRYDRLPVKDRRSWSFVVDRALNVLGIQAWSVAQPVQAIFPVQKFAILDWDTRDNDPRGNSIFRRAYKPWDIESQLMPKLFTYGMRFAEPSIKAKSSPDSATRPVYLADDLTPDTGNSDVTPEQDLEKAVQAFQGGSYLVLPPGADAEYLELRGEGGVYERLFGILDRKMVLAILLQVRATLEAKFGSRADSQTGQDVLGTILLYAREYAAQFIEWQLLYDLVLWNYGRQVAQRHTPECSLGEVEHQDIAAMLQAWARVGYKVADSQLPVIDTMLGLPARTPEEVAAAQQAKQNAAKAQQPGQGQQQQEQESARV